MGSLEEVDSGNNNGSSTNTENVHELPRSASSLTCNSTADAQQRPQNSPSVHSQLSGIVIAPKSHVQVTENNKIASTHCTPPQVRIVWNNFH